MIKLQFMAENKVSFRTRSSSLEGATKLIFVPFCSS